MANRTLADLIAFLEYMSSKGLMAKNTVGGRKAAVGKVLGVLDPEEVEDVFTINVDQAMARFINLEGKSYTPNSLKVYRSRVSSSIDDFREYLKDPASFQPTKPSRAQSKAKASGGAGKPKAQTTNSKNSENSSGQSEQFSSSSNVLPIPIRQNVVVRIFNLPFDLTPQEASKIANVVKAMAME